MGDPKRTCPDSVTRSSHSTAIVQRRLAWGVEPQGPAQPSGSTAGDRKGVDTSRFVLIVDDDPDLLDVTSFVIENEGMAVETARNGEEALALLGAGRLPGLVLLDLMMPVMNGWEFLAAVAKDPLLQAIPIVVLTAADHTEIPGAMEVLNKPMDLKELIRVVERYVPGDKDAGA